eukprot:6856841-Prymnesium_polylepis.1
MRRPPSQHDSPCGLLARVMTDDNKEQITPPVKPTARCDSSSTKSSVPCDVFQEPKANLFVNESDTLYIAVSCKFVLHVFVILMWIRGVHRVSGSERMRQTRCRGHYCADFLC